MNNRKASVQPGRAQSCADSDCDAILPRGKQSYVGQIGTVYNCEGLEIVREVEH